MYTYSVFKTPNRNIHCHSVMGERYLKISEWAISHLEIPVAYHLDSKHSVTYVSHRLTVVLTRSRFGILP